MSFLELYDFMIYQHVNKRAKILPFAPFTLSIYVNSLIEFALPISMPRFKSIICYQNSPKIKLFLKKKAKFSSAGGFAPRSPCLRRLAALPPHPQTQTPNCEFLAARLPHFALLIIIRIFLAFVLNNFFLIVQLQTI